MTPPDPAFEAALEAALDAKTKPVGALGRVEALAKVVARVQGTLAPRAESAELVVFAADHGLAAPGAAPGARTGLSAYPQSVTRQMVLNLLDGGAAATVFAAALGVGVRIVDAGVAGEPVAHPELLSRRIGPGTRNALNGPAMTAAQLERALAAGREIGAAMDADIACFGEMGIGNTSSAALVAAKLLARVPSALAGRGTGLDAAGLAAKGTQLDRAAARRPGWLPAETALIEYGGFEIAMMAGAMAEAATARRLVVVDGFIASAAALCARELSPGCERAFIHAHRSAEAGHGVILRALGAEPLLDLDMRLGEGTGAVLAVPLVRAAAAMLREMASFESAGVSGPLSAPASASPPE